MNPTPKRRRSQSPITPPSLGRDRHSGGGPSSSSVPLQHRPASPANPTLPPPIPSYPVYAPPPAGPGPSTWQSWRGPERGRSRHSMDARSQGSEDMMSPRMDPLDEIGEVVFTRDTSNRAPRSMMACTRCRRQKMKCDGPSQVPCRGCRQSGSACIFEARSRPKSISTMPAGNRGSFYAGGPPGPGSPAPQGFYPVQPIPAPPLTSRHTPAPPEPPAFRQAREPMPPPPATSIGALTSPHPRALSPTTVMAVPGPPQAPLPPPQPAAPSSSYYHPPQPMQLAPVPSSQPPQAAPPTPTGESRLRALESSLRPLQSLPHQVNSIQQALAMLQRGQESLLASFPRLQARDSPAEVPEAIWEAYRSRAWPLTPWLVGLREAAGLPSLVISVLGKRTLSDKAEDRRRDTEESTKAVYDELGRLIAERAEMTREEIRALGAFSTWVSDSALACMTVGHARAMSLDRINAKRSHDDWREWIYISIMDKITHVVDFKQPVTNDVLALAWRERLQSSASVDPAVRDRDLKLLAWLEYAETLVEVFQAQQKGSPPHAPSDQSDDDTAAASDDKSSPLTQTSPKISATSFQSGGVGGGAAASSVSAAGPGSAGQGPGNEERDLERKRAMSVWKKFAGKIEAWAGSWSVRTDPILSLHFNYAVLLAASPIYLGGNAVWAELSSSHEGFQQLERGRDAAFAVIQAICSEIGRTLTYSFGLYRPLLGLALAHLISLALALPSSPMISQTHVLTVLRSTYDTITAANPFDAISPPRPDSRDSRTTQHHTLLAEMVLGSKGLAAGKEILGDEPGRETWRRILG